MFDLKLLLGIAADVEFEQIVGRTNPNLVSLLMSGGDYLSEISLDNQRYLCKPIPLSTTVNQLENIEIHLLSLLRKLAPNYSFAKNPPVLITSFDDSSSI